jgi:regulator of nucleoside diphosphate kinase
LVYPEEADAAVGRISVLSPLGWSQLGLRAGEEAQFETPGDGGPRRIRVLQVSFQPEAAGQWML